MSKKTKTKAAQELKQEVKQELKQELKQEGIPYIVNLPEPHIFEGKTYTEIDLFGLENLTTEDMGAAELMFTRMGYTDPVKEFNTVFCLILASYAINQPYEFFKNMKMYNATKIKERVSAFLFKKI